MNKTIGGWLFDDLKEDSDKEKNSKRFIYAWRRAGPLCC
jgi:hypothetical protein